MTTAHPWTAADTFDFLPAPTAKSHKYSRGVLGLRTGSSAYPGAAVLGAEAAWRTGIGLVQFVPQRGDVAPEHGLPTPASAVLSARPETVVSTDASRCHAWVIGSGTDPSLRSSEEREALLRVLAGETPIVVDAGALDVELLDVAGESPHAPTILTPHTGELARLAISLDITTSHDPETVAMSLARKLQVTVLLKGSVTLSASPSGQLLQTGPATPRLATAGTGDVLAGILGSLVAQHSASQGGGIDHDTLGKIGATASLLHDQAARLAAGVSDDCPTDVGRPITALDVAQAVPAAVARLRALH